MRTDKERIYDILDSIEDIEKYLPEGQVNFLQDEKMQSFFMYRFIIIGEAASRISDEFQEKYSHIPWSKIVAMRNIMTHEYFGVSIQEIWDTSVKSLPVLKKDI